MDSQADFRGLIPALNSRGGCFLFSSRHNGIRRSARPRHSNLRYRLLMGAGYANMYAREHWHVVLCGCIGGILPNLLDLAGQLINQDLGKWYSDPADIFLALLAPFLAYLIYFGVGGFITMVFKETNPMKAVVLGVSAPALIAGWLSGGAPEAAPVRLGELFGVSTAYAEDHLRLPEDHHRVRVGFIIPERLEAKHGLKYKLIDQSGKALGFGTFGGLCMADRLLQATERRSI